MAQLFTITENTKRIDVDGTRENVEIVTEFIVNNLRESQIDRKIIAQISVAIDELYSNIAQYAYGDQIGKVTVLVEVSNGSIAITFADSGKQFNPLDVDNPDITLDADERGIGGLGIFIVRQTMDDITYAYENGMNVLKITKSF